MSTYWTYLNEANRLIDLSRGDSRMDPRRLAQVMRRLRRELALRYERRSLVYVDDDSQKLFDRWMKREVWAFVPTVENPWYSLQSGAQVSPREVSGMQQDEAFAIALPGFRREATLGALAAAARLIEERLRGGRTDPGALGDLLSSFGRLRHGFFGRSIVVEPFEVSTGMGFLIASGRRFKGVVEARRQGGTWEVGTADEVAGLVPSQPEGGGPLFEAEADIDRARGGRRVFRLDHASARTLRGLHAWIHQQVELADRGRSGMTYDVALSFAGEDRKTAEAIAARLKLRGYSVFFDAYEQASLWGTSLTNHLTQVYGQRAAWCVILVSRFYLQKVWTIHELEAARARALRESREVILPVSLDSTRLPDLGDDTVYLDLPDLGIEGVVDLLVEKIG